MVLLVGCSGPGSGASTSAGRGGVAVGSQPVGTGNSGSSPTAETARQVVTTATASVTVKDPADSAQRVSELVESLGGRVDERTEQSAQGDGRASADLVVRVPAAKLTGLLADLKKLGHVTDVSVTRADVTGTAVDLDARISALRTSVARLQGLMNSAATTDALLAAEKALSDRQANLESLQSQRALLADQVALSTLTVHLESVSAAPARGPHGFLGGLAAGWRALVSTLAATVVVLGVLLPWFVLAALVAAVVLVALRRVRRQRRRARPGSAGPGTPSEASGPPQGSEHAPV